MNYHMFTLEMIKRHPLAISRGVRARSMNLFVALTADGCSGLGEAVPDHDKDFTVEDLQQQLTQFLAEYDISQLAVQTIWQQAKEAQLEPPVLAALDMALWDLVAKRGNLPLYQLFGLPQQSIATSITIGIMSPQQAEQRALQIMQQQRPAMLKIKLGSPQGVEADQAMFTSIKQVAERYPVKLMVDANGGWSLADAKMMLSWLAQRDVEYVEQPLAKGSEDQLPELYHQRPLPIFVDESCHFSCDVPPLAAAVDGINIKLMKCGGLSEALRLIAVARAHGLKTMIGCMSESTVSISAACAIAPLIDDIDLDSHLNLVNNPAQGVGWNEQGELIMQDKPGLGVELNEQITS